MKIGVYFLEGNGRGDVLLLTPALRGLRQKYPDAHIGCVIKHSELLWNNPDLDAVFEANPVSRRPFDDLYAQADLNLYTDYWRHRLRLKSTHVCDLLCELCGIAPQGRSLDLYLTADELNKGFEIIRSTTRRSTFVATVAIQVGAGTPNREWPMPKWQSLVDGLREVKFIQFGGPKDSQIKGAVRLAGELTAREIASAVSFCDAFVTVDSYLNHAATAANKRGVVLFGSSDPIGFGHPQNINLIHREVECAPCYRPVVGHYDLMPDPKDPTQLVAWVCDHRSCLHALSVDEVSKALLTILNRG